MSTKDIRALETLAKAAELGSLRKAAVALGVTAQAASQTVAQIERSLGVRLLHRTTRSLSLTEAGRVLLEATQPAIFAIERALASARSVGDEVSGPLRIVGPSAGFAEVLWPVIDEYCTQYPEVLPEIKLDDGIGDWVLDRADVGFRFGVQPADSLIARALFSVQMIICAAPAYLRKHGVPRSLDDLPSHRCSVYRHPTTGKVFPWFVNVGGEIQARDLPPAFVTNDIDLEVKAALSGQVIAQLSSISAADFIRRGMLVPLFCQNITEHMQLYAYYDGTRMAQPMRVRAFIDLAVTRLTGNTSLTITREELRRFDAATTFR